MEQRKVLLWCLTVTLASSYSVVKRGIPDSLVTGRCPPPSDLSPYCECSVNVYVATVQISCQNLPNGKELKSVLSQPLKKKNFDWLYITKSNLTSVPSSLLGKNSFSGVLVSQNEIGTITDDAFTESNMYALWIAYNKMESFNFRCLDSLSSLREATLMGNQLTTIPTDAFVNLMALKNIALDENFIAHLETGAFKNLPKLRQISLTKNNLTRLRSGVFKETASQQEVSLNLANNKIKSIEDGAFEGLSLEGLDLRYNDLQTLSRGVFEPIVDSMCDETGRYLYLTGNPIACDSSLLWLVKKSHDCRKHIRGLTCDDGRSLKELTPENLIKVH